MELTRKYNLLQIIKECHNIKDNYSYIKYSQTHRTVIKRLKPIGPNANVMSSTSIRCNIECDANPGDLCCFQCTRRDEYHCSQVHNYSCKGL